MQNIARALVISAAVFMSACASNSYSELYEFYPVETNTDSKRFSYQFILGADNRAINTNSAPPRGGAVSFEDMRLELKKYMAANPYCTEGYFVYDELFDGTKYTLLGECQESK